MAYSADIVGFDVDRSDTEDGEGWVEILDKGLIVALRTWLKLARIGHGQLSRRMRGRGKDVQPNRLTNQLSRGWSNARPLPTGVRADLPEASARRSLPDIHCALASPPWPRWTSATSRRSSAMPARK
ncbi:hypothetical protein ACVWW6_009102 [Bradyrhizobium sp. USDA 3311]